ncbi:MAG: 1-acyl-sn-glycerol-3-phosphate acyltransferase [Pseudomonadota bacterium]
MRHRIDPLIAERAPWLYHNWPAMSLVRSGLHTLLGYHATVALAEGFTDESAPIIMQQMGQRLANHVSVSGLGHIPSHGPALIVANHPTGIADGIILHSLVSKVRKDAYFFANRDILRVLPQLDCMIAPVEWRTRQRSHATTRQTMAYVRAATAAGRLGVIFPSGRLAKRRGLRLYERPWMASAAMLARKSDMPVIPVNIQARNSALFYLFDMIHPTLRDITLFHETLNKSGQLFRITIGEPISAASIPRNSEDGIKLLRKATLALGGHQTQTVNLLSASRLRGGPVRPD